jgi:hypothetical protein
MMVLRTRVIVTAGSQGDTNLAAEVINQENPQELESCIDTSERLLHILMAEAEALRTFQKERLLELIAEKEVVACELAHRVKAFESSPSFIRKNSQKPLLLKGSTGGDTKEAKKWQHTRLDVLRQILGEITRCNQRNRLFVQGSLSHWENLLNLCLPGTYAAGHDGQAVRQSFRAKGLSLNREI